MTASERPPKKPKVTMEDSRAAFRARLEALVGPGDLPRFSEALTHSSYSNETRVNGTGEPERPDNQRLEFLGDSVLGLCVSELLSRAHPTADEGELTRMRSALVNADALAAWARSEDLAACLQLGRGANAAREREQTNVLADATEALVAAVYEARGIEGARTFVETIVRPSMLSQAELGGLDPKSALQEQVQAERLPAPSYRLAETRGPQHDLEFEVLVMVGDQVLARGTGRSKRIAERAAAEAGLVAFSDARSVRAASRAAASTAASASASGSAPPSSKTPSPE